jgi:hypothetical protein
MLSLRTFIATVLICVFSPLFSLANGANVPVTMVVDVPYAPKGSPVTYYPPSYQDLLKRLQSPFAVNRILLHIESPAWNQIYGLGSDVQSSGGALQFLSQLPADVEVYAYPDVEGGDPPVWNAWPCGGITGTDPHADALKSICWVTSANQLLAAAHSLARISGIVYEGQSFEDKDDAQSGVLGAAVHSAPGHLKFGWISSGPLVCNAGVPAADCADINFIEVYDLNKGSMSPAPATPYRVDTIAPETVVGGAFVASVAQGPTGPCDPTQGTTISNPYSPIEYGSNIFPGIQMSGVGSCDTKHNKWVPTGAVGANIYACAIDSKDSNNNCTLYSVIPAGSPEDQIMSSLAYIYNVNPDSKQLTASELNGNSNVVYLFSAQYIGPVGSYAGSGLQCSEKANNCHCVASKYDPLASCGDEAGFGTWGSAAGQEGSEYLGNFQNFLANFSAQVCGTSPTCGVGIYMYDYLPVHWFQDGA